MLKEQENGPKIGNVVEKNGGEEGKRSFATALGGNTQRSILRLEKHEHGNQGEKGIN